MRALSSDIETGERDAISTTKSQRAMKAFATISSAHYRVNRRTDTQYWRDNAANQNLSDNLKSMMTSWFRGEDLSATIADLDIGQYYSSLSWHCLFAGYGTFPPDEKIMPPGDDIAQIDMAAIDDFWARCAMNYGDHKTLLRKVMKC